MNKTAGRLLGIAAAAGAIGIGVSIFADHHHSFINSRAVKKNLNKAVKNISSFVDDVTDIIHQ
ncbi:MAG: hypothetical protein LBC56_00235 [Oscillospiraceae bacterium]|jgi:hypothetical protein|nr:hypothetical protein [Oscillospiraceae bacterium]